MGASSSATGCALRTTEATWIAPYYVVGTAAEIWQETNGADGLQRTASSCVGHPALPADTCITHTENQALVACATSYAIALAP